MAQILVRNLDDGVVDRLKELAARRGISLEQEVREILGTASRRTRDEVIAHMDFIRSRQPAQTSRAVDLIREDRDR